MEKNRYRVIVCAITGSEVSQKAVLGAALLAKENEAHLILVYAVDASFVKGTTVELPTGFAEEQMERLGNKLLDQAENIAKEQGTSCEKIMRKGPLLKVIAEVASETGGELLVLGLESRSFFEKILFGATLQDDVRELRRQTGLEVAIIR